MASKFYSRASTRVPGKYRIESAPKVHGRTRKRYALAIDIYISINCNCSPPSALIALPRVISNVRNDGALYNSSYDVAFVFRPRFTSISRESMKIGPTKRINSRYKVFKYSKELDTDVAAIQFAEAPEESLIRIFVRKG